MLLPILESYVDFPHEIPEIDRRSLIRDAVHKASTGERIDRDSLERCLREAEEAYLRRPIQPFVLVTSWTLGPYAAMKRIRVPGVSIVFGPPNRSPLNRKAVQHLIEEVLPYEPPQMLQVKAHLKARTAAGAYEVGQHALDSVRGQLNYLINKRTVARLFSNSQRPINKILAGPLHTVHKPNGSLAEPTLWYETFRIDKVAMESRDALSKWENSARLIRKRIHQSDYAADIEHGFVRYARALDLADPSVAFSKLWTAVEFLAATSDQEEIVQRLLRLTAKEDRRLVAIAFRHVQDVRNGLVHIDEKRKLSDVRAGMDAHVYQLKMFAEWLLKFHIRVCRRFATRRSAMEILDVPLESDELRRRIKLYRNALKRSGS